MVAGRSSLGPPARALLPDALRTPKTTLEIDDRVFSEPMPDALPPLEALGWLAGKLAENGARLQAGDIVMSGSLLAPVSISPRPRYVAITVAGIGTLAFSG